MPITLENVEFTYMAKTPYERKALQGVSLTVDKGEFVAVIGHDGELSVIIDPWAGLVGLLESPDFVGCIRVLPSVPHLARLRCPEVHSPRTCNSGIGVPG